MELLLRRNYLVLLVQQASDEHVLVETLAGEKFHERWLGFGLSGSSGRPLLIPCNGWRYSSEDSWQYLDQGEYLAGSQTPSGIVGMIDNNLPVIVER